MEIEQTLGEKTIVYTFEFDSEIFIKYLKNYLDKHISQWDSEYAFNGEDVVINFFNEVIEKGDITERIFSK
ncbi:hypothetical protein DS742_23660 [Lacrimispora amygdalina]|uniref:Uncharacterized protein n=1 Tax=Lacrimispora amygdalina TaxID=253257 RepID=A0A3E2N5Z9_9FIRM|nr:hypothetical protein DS742_23660 [Clostridium indicum]